ncbi:MAG: hypothetical protein IKN26_08440 [Eubacterium sp.]|nr:hypothetical protein [Eubacterium sp.]
MKFESFVGNEKIKTQLGALLEAERFPHAIIIEGEEGIGKRTLSLEIALSLICKSEEERPCRSCSACKKVLKHIHPDIYEYAAPDRARSFSVDIVRDIIEDAYVQPNEADYKIYILSNCQSMGAPAQNAILKILEEPPSYAVFILCTTNKSAMLETVLSRSVAISVEGVNCEEGARFICEKLPEIDSNEAIRALTICNGNIGKALETLDDGKLKKTVEISNELAVAMIADNEYELIKACAVFEKDNQTLIASLTFLKSVLRDAMLFESGVSILSNQNQCAKLLASRLTKGMLLKMINVCDNIISLAKGNGNNALLITKLCYDLRRAQKR